MLPYKKEPKFKVYNEHTQKLEDILTNSMNSDSSQKDSCLVRKSKLFFSSVPILILLQQHDHWKLIVNNFKTKDKHQAQNCF